MRILHLNHTGVVSGAELSLLTLVDVLRTRHEVLLAAPPGDLLVRAGGLGVPTIAVRGSDVSWKLHPWPTPRALAATVRAGRELTRSLGRAVSTRARELRPRGPDRSAARAGLAARRSSCTSATISGPVAAGSLKSLIATRAGGIIAVSGFVAAEWAEVHSAGAKLARVYNPIDCGTFHPGPARPPSGVPPTGSRGTLAFAVVGQITPWKRQIHGIDVFRAVLEDRPARARRGRLSEVR